MKKITIIGWTDGFGKWLGNFIIKNYSNEILLTITWRNKEKWILASEEVWCNFSTNNIKSVENADIIIFSVPIFCMESTIKEVLPSIKENSIVLDVTSIKWFTTKTMQKYAPKWVLVIPTHPMFWPYYNNLDWQIVVLTPNNQTKEDIRYKKLKEILSAKWIKIIEATPKEHDKMMAVVQWLTHYNFFVLWETVKRLKIDIKRSMNFVSPIYKVMMSSVARYVWQNPKLYSDIQMFNDEVLSVHKVFMEASEDFNGFIKDKNENSFVSMIKETGEYFWKENTNDWQKYTDKITYLVSKQANKIKSGIWKYAKFENIYSWETLEWKIIDFDYKNITLENWKNIDVNEWGIL